MRLSFFLFKIMAVTMNQMVYDLKNLVSGGVQSDDTKPSDRQVAYWINQTRSKLIRQEFSKRGKIHDSWVQHFNVEFEEVGLGMNNSCDTSCEKHIFRSKCKIPTTIQRGHKNGIIAVMPLAGSTTSLSDESVSSYSESTFYRKNWHQYSKYGKNSKRWYLKGDYMYVIGAKPKALQISALLEDPEEEKNCSNCTPEKCWNWDSPYPITLEMAGTITDILIKRMGIIIESPEDNNNNATSGPKQDTV